jgi:hypothetical protein
MRYDRVEEVSFGIRNKYSLASECTDRDGYSGRTTAVQVLHNPIAGAYQRDQHGAMTHKVKRRAGPDNQLLRYLPVDLNAILARNHSTTLNTFHHHQNQTR